METTILIPRPDSIASLTLARFYILAKRVFIVFMAIRTVRFRQLDGSANQGSGHRTPSAIDIHLSRHWLKMIRIHATAVRARRASLAFGARIMALVADVHLWRNWTLEGLVRKHVSQRGERLEILLDAKSPVSAFGELPSPKPAARVGLAGYLRQKVVNQVTLTFSHAVLLNCIGQGCAVLEALLRPVSILSQPPIARGAN